MWKEIIKYGFFYAFIGPIICGVFLSILIFGMSLITGNTTLSVSELGTSVLIIVGWSYIMGFFPAFFTGALISRSKLGLGNINKKNLFAYGFIATLVVLVALDFNYIIVMPKLLIGIVFPAILGGFATIFLERVVRKFT